MRTGLFTDQSLFLHQAAYFEAADTHAIVLHHCHDAAAARRASALREQLIHPAAQKHPLKINILASAPMCVVTGPGNIEHRTAQFNGLLMA
jgi:hypothetical protein